MKKIIVMFMLLFTVYIIRDWFNIGQSTRCIVTCVDNSKVMVCRHENPVSANSPTVTNLGVCK